MDAATARGLRDEIELSESRAALAALRARVETQEDGLHRRDLLRACQRKGEELTQAAHAFRCEPWAPGRPMPLWLAKVYHARIWSAGRRTVLEAIVSRINDRHAGDAALEQLRQAIGIRRGHLGDQG